MNTIKKVYSPYGKMFAAVAIFALVLWTFGYALPQTARADKPVYNIGANPPNINGLGITWDGTASGGPVAGQVEDHRVCLDWDDDQDSTTHNWVDANSFDVSTTSNSFSGSWAGNHLYSSSGTYTIFARIAHASCNGAESSDAQTQTTVIVVTPTATSTLTLVKNVSGGNAQASAWTLSAVGATSSISGASGSSDVTNQTVDAGTYTLSESGGPGGYTPGSWSCTAGTMNGTTSVTLAAGDDATCSITNTYNAPTSTATGTLTIVKNVVSGSATSSDFTLNVLDDQQQQVESDPGSANGVSYTLDVGNYTVTENTAQGYTSSFASCGTDGAVTVSEGQETVCTVENRALPQNAATGTVIIEKEVTSPVNNWSFDFTGDLGSFALTNSTTSKTFTDVATGTYGVSETALQGWTQDSASCLYEDKSTSSPDAIVVKENQTVTCTFKNSENPPATGTLVVIKDVVSGSSTPSDFTLNVLDDQQQQVESDPGSASGTVYTLPVGNYEVTEDNAPNYFSSFQGCGENGLVAVSENSTTTCTVSNRYSEADTYRIFGSVWNDKNNNGDFDEGEPNLKGWTVKITDGTTTMSTTTDADGNYYFDVPAGTWTITEKVKNEWHQTFPTSPSSYTVTVPLVVQAHSSNLFAALFNYIVPTAEAATVGSAGSFNFGNHFVGCTSNCGGGGGGGGGGGAVSLVEGTSTASTPTTGPVPQVLGAQVNNVPTAAPNTGAGGAAHTNPLNSALALFGMLLSFGVLRATRNG